jgi:molybdopterin-guanine dinucleotide biosynthesis protein A
MDLPCIAATAKPAAVLGAVLAGGRARRLGGGDKALQMLGGRPLLDHVLDRLRPQLGEIVLNANGDPARFAGWKLPVVPDVLDGQGGPLVGVLSCLDWTRANRPGVNVLVTVPCDTPFLPEDLIGRLLTARAEAGTALAVARSR